MNEQDRGTLKRLTTSIVGSSSTEVAPAWSPGRGAAATAGLWPEHEQALGLDLRQLLGMLWVRKWLFAGTFTTIFTLVTLVFLSLAPQYEAVSSVLIAPDEPIVEVRSMIAPLSTKDEAILSENEVIRSKPLVHQVIDEIGFRAYLVAPPPPSRLELLLGISFTELREWLANAGASDTTEEPADDKVMRAFYDRLEVSRVPDTSVIAIQFQASDPVLAASAANRLADAYVTSQVKAKRSARADAIALLTERLHELRKRVSESDQAVERFRTEAGLVKSVSTELINQQLENQLMQLAAERAQQRTLQGRLAELETLRAGGANDQLYDLLGAPAVQHLRGEVLQLQREITRQSQEVGPKHPTMIGLDADLREANFRLSTEVNNAVQAVRSEATMAAERVREVEHTIAALKEEMAGLNAKEYTLRSLEAEAEINRSLHDAIVNRMREAEDAVFERADARILNRADVPTLPAESKGKLLMLAALIGAFCASGGVALGIEFLKGGFRTEEEVADALGRPMLAAVPRVPAWNWRPTAGHGEAIRRYGPAHIEAFHALHTSLELVGVGPTKGKAPTVLVTSAIPDEGKSTVVSGLARLAAEMGARVLVIDCDLRRPSVHSHFGIDNRTGLSTCDLEEPNPYGDGLVKVHRSSGVQVIPAGPSPSNPQRLLRSPLLPRILMASRSAHELILIDSSPVLAVADPLVVGQLCDVVLLVVKWGSTPRRLVRRAMTRISAGGVPVAGCVLNQVAPSTYKADKYKYLSYS